MQDVLSPHEISFFQPIRPMAMAMLLSSPWIAFAGPLHQGKIETTVNLSQGFRHGDTVFFLADVHRYRPGRTFWFILPLKAGPKTLSHQTRLYSLETKTNRLKLESILRDPAELTCMVSSAKWVLKGEGLYLAYNPSNRISSLTNRTECAVFRRDMATGAVEAVPDPEKVHYELFAGYKSPYRDNPGITEISAYKPLLPAGWETGAGR
jgi:hypothetical protein